MLVSRRYVVASKNRIFISFAIEDDWARTYLVGQAKNERSSFEFVDMSVKKPWDQAWKTQCRTRIKGCDGVVALVSKNTRTATGQLWEISCAKQESVPIRGIYTTTDDRPLTLPTEFSGVRVVGWTWSNISTFLGGL
jgi:hypothetical protein